jgi:hypothetical protein
MLEALNELRRLWYCIRNHGELTREREWKAVLSQRQSDLLQHLETLGFTWRIGDPTRDIGTALELADEYGIEIHRGTCFGDCIAFIPRNRWRYPINKSIKSGRYGTWLEDKDPDTIKHIAAWNTSVPMAISGCLVNARIAGVV